MGLWRAHAVFRQCAVGAVGAKRCVVRVQATCRRRRRTASRCGRKQSTRAWGVAKGGKKVVLIALAARRAPSTASLFTSARAHLRSMVPPCATPCFACTPPHPRHPCAEHRVSEDSPLAFTAYHLHAVDEDCLHGARVRSERAARERAARERAARERAARERAARERAARERAARERAARERAAIWAPSTCLRSNGCGKQPFKHVSEGAEDCAELTRRSYDLCDVFHVTTCAMCFTC